MISDAVKLLRLGWCALPLFFSGLLAVAAERSIETLKIPAGFKLEIFAADVENARQLALGDKGTVFVGSRSAGNVYALVDDNADHRADRQLLIASDLNMPSGLAFKNGALYVAAVSRVLRYDDIENTLANPPPPVTISAELPRDGHHGWKYLKFAPDGDLFVPVGMPCNICLKEDARYGTLLKLDVKTGQYAVYAKGVRNSVGFDIEPNTGHLWFTDNGRDWLGDDAPPDEINRADRPGLDFGFPALHGSSVRDPQYGKAADLSGFTLPVVELGAHVAPLGMAFYTGKTFPEKYRDGFFVAEHGSWNRSEKTGYRVIFVKPGSATAKPVVEPFITGWLNRDEDTAWGRPVDILNLPDGSLLISDDYADVIYRVSYQ